MGGRGKKSAPSSSRSSARLKEMANAKNPAAMEKVNEDEESSSKGVVSFNSSELGQAYKANLADHAAYFQHDTQSLNSSQELERVFHEIQAKQAALFEYDEGIDMSEDEYEIEDYSEIRSAPSLDRFLKGSRLDGVRDSIRAMGLDPNASWLGLPPGVTKNGSSSEHNSSGRQSPNSGNGYSASSNMANVVGPTNDTVQNLDSTEVHATTTHAAGPLNDHPLQPNLDSHGIHGQNDQAIIPVVPSSMPIDIQSSVGHAQIASTEIPAGQFQNEPKSPTIGAHLTPRAHGHSHGDFANIPSDNGINSTPPVQFSNQPHYVQISSGKQVEINFQSTTQSDVQQSNMHLDIVHNSQHAGKVHVNLENHLGDNPVGPHTNFQQQMIPHVEANSIADYMNVNGLESNLNSISHGDKTQVGGPLSTNAHGGPANNSNNNQHIAVEIQSNHAPSLGGGQQSIKGNFSSHDSIMQAGQLAEKTGVGNIENQVTLLSHGVDANSSHYPPAHGPAPIGSAFENGQQSNRDISSSHFLHQNTSQTDIHNLGSVGDPFGKNSPTPFNNGLFAELQKEFPPLQNASTKPTDSTMDRGSNYRSAWGQNASNGNNLVTNNWQGHFLGELNNSLKLNYVDGFKIKDGRKIAVPPANVFQEGSIHWNCCLIGQFIGKPPPFFLIRRMVDTQWKKFGHVDIQSNEYGLFVFRFESQEFCDRVMQELWHVHHHSLLLRRWETGLQLIKLNCERVPIWLKLRNVPLDLLTKDGLSFVSSTIGIPLQMDSKTASRSHLGYARVCVEMNILKDLPDRTFVELLNGEEAEILIEYDWKPPKCTFCNVAGHDTSNCPNSQEDRDDKISADPKPEWNEARKKNRRRRGASRRNENLVCNNRFNAFDIDDVHGDQIDARELNFNKSMIVENQTVGTGVFHKNTNVRKVNIPNRVNVHQPTSHISVTPYPSQGSKDKVTTHNIGKAISTVHVVDNSFNNASTSKASTSFDYAKAVQGIFNGRPPDRKAH